MVEYIERKAVILFIFEYALRHKGNSRIFSACKNLERQINSIPASDVRPVVHGMWNDAIQSCHDSPHVKCSVCGEYYWRYFNKFKFCPNCGAEMR